MRFIIRVIYLSLIIIGIIRRNTKIQDGDTKSFKIYGLVIYIYTEIYMFSSAAAIKSYESIRLMFFHSVKS